MAREYDLERLGVELSEAKELISIRLAQILSLQSTIAVIERALSDNPSEKEIYYLLSNIQKDNKLGFSCNPSLDNLSK